MAFALNSGARHSLFPPEDGTSNDAAGFASCYGPLAIPDDADQNRWLLTAATMHGWRARGRLREGHSGGALVTVTGGQVMMT